jgi:hypothetical protein
MVAANVTRYAGWRPWRTLGSIKTMTQFESREAFIGTSGLQNVGKANEQALNGDSVADDNTNHASPEALGFVAVFSHLATGGLVHSPFRSCALEVGISTFRLDETTDLLGRGKDHVGTVTLHSGG